MRTPIVTVVLAAVVAVAACGGGGGAAGEPLVSGSLTGHYKGQSFTPMFGFATTYGTNKMIGVGDGPLNCASPQQPDPPWGTNAVISVPAFEVGAYSSRLVQILHNLGNYEGTGTNTGSLELTSVTADSVAGSITYSYTDDDGQTYGLSGTFEVVHCAN
jgi:hypothetical protein